jgi:hypothetical protein
MERAWSFAGWYCRRGGTLSGPFRPEQIKRLVHSRRLRPTDRVWEKWTHGRESLLFPALASTASGLAKSSPRKGRARCAPRGSTRAEPFSAPVEKKRINR